MILTKDEFISELASRSMFSQYAVKELFNLSSEIVVDTVIKGENVELPFLGGFSLSKRKMSVYKNLFGEKEKLINSTTYPTFKISTTLKSRIKKRILASQPRESPKKD